MKTDTMITKTRDGSPQEFNYYRTKSTGKYVVRFYVTNYIPNGKKREQWTGRGCQFDNMGAAVEFGKFVCQNIKTSKDYTVIRDFLESNYKFIKSTSIDLMEFVS